MRLELGKCEDLLASLETGSVHAIVTDPPYGIRFMGEAWDGAEIEADVLREQERKAAQNERGEMPVRLTGDLDNPGSRKVIKRSASAFATPAGEAGSYDFSLKGNRAFQAWCETWGAEALRVLRPGGYALVFGGCRTHHRLTCALEEAGFEIRDELAWMFGSGFPKSADVERFIARRTCPLPGRHFPRALPEEEHRQDGDHVCPVTVESAEWLGWGTALKPAHEPIIVARKPFRGPVDANVREHGTGALHIDACRIPTADDLNGGAYSGERRQRPEYTPTDSAPGAVPFSRHRQGAGEFEQPDGRWPANVLLDELAAEWLDAQSGDRAAGNHPAKRSGRGDEKIYGSGWSSGTSGERIPTGTGGASRFFYVAKASRAEREAGLGPEHELQPLNWSSGDANPGSFQSKGTNRLVRNHHPTVKPIDLMRWCVRLVTPPGGTVLDPFTGSGTTAIACVLEGYEFVGAEREPGYHEVALARVRFWQEHGEDGLRIVRERDAAERASEERRAELAATGQLDLLAELA